MDTAAGVAFYDHQSQSVGEYFFRTIFDDIERLSDSAGNDEVYLGYFRRIALKHPFLIYYRMVVGGAEVVAVLDGRSQPSDLDSILRRR